MNRNSNGNLYVRYLYWNDSRWNWNNNWLDNNFNDNDPAAVSATLLISLLHFVRRVLFCKLSIPTTQHFAYFIYFCR